MKRKRTITVTADINVNLKKLRKLEAKGLIEIYQIDIETPSPKTKKVLPTAVVDYTCVDKCVVGSEEESQNFEKIKTIIGKQNIKDAMHLANHMRDGRDYFVTGDKDILSKREELYRIFPVLRIKKTNELVCELGNK